jgi:tetratricopeptide (TPR) repeat protein
LGAMEEEPKTYRAIMVSSTFTDLEAHRREAIDAILRFGFRPIGMEYSGARSDADVIDASLQMVRAADAYLCVIGHKYGQTPADDRNPKGLSITELEFNEARERGKPILLFVMAEDHPGTKADFESDPKKKKKLEAFCKQAKRVDPAKAAERVYDTFASKDEFAKKAAYAVGLLAIQTTGKPAIPDRAIRDAIARFIDVKPDANQTELTDAIGRFEAGYRALEEQLAAIAVSDNRVTSLKADAEAALAEGDLDKARAAYREAAEAARDKAAEPVRTAAELKAAEAGAHLLALDWQAADAAWTEAAEMLAPFDSDAADELAEGAGDRLRLHGELYAHAGALSAAIGRWHALAKSAEARGDQREVARLRNNLGHVLMTQGARTGGSEGLRLLDEAATACRDALAVRTRADMPAESAGTQNNLGNVLATQGERTGGPEGLRLLDEGVTAYREALAIYTHADMPGDWAMTQNNLGNALSTQGERTSGSEGLRLLDEAVTAYRYALTVYTHSDMPIDWAMTQNNLGAALRSQGERTGGSEGLRLLDQAVTAYRDALTVRTRAEMPAKWAMTQENIGLALGSMAEADPDRARAHLLDAEVAFVAALDVYTPEHMAFYHDKATRSLAHVREKLAALDS